MRGCIFIAMDAILGYCTFTFRFSCGEYYVFVIERFTATLYRFQDSEQRHLGAPYGIIEYDLTDAEKYLKFREDVFHYFRMSSCIQFIEHE